MARVEPTWCEDHRTPYLALCPFCRDGLEPVRFGEAREDFRGVPLEGTLDVLPHQTTVRFDDVVYTLGQQLADIERAQILALRPFHVRRAEVLRQMRQAKLDHVAYSRAVHIHVLEGDPRRSRAFDEDEKVQTYLGILRGVGVE